MKKTILLLVIIIGLCTAWFFGWHFVADQVEQALENGKAKLASQDKVFQCLNQEIGGFPFRINLTCAETTYIDNQQGFSIEAGELRSAAQAYQPGKAVAEMDGPAVMMLNNSDIFELNWGSLRSSFRAGLSGVETFSTVAKTLAVNPTTSKYGTFTVEELQLHGRKAEENHVDLAAISRKVISKDALWPEFDLALNFRLSDVYQHLKQNPNLKRIARERGLKGQLTELRYSSAKGGSVTISGPMKIDTNGLLSGKFDVKVSQLKPLLQSLAKALPQQQKMFEQAGIAASLLGGRQNGGELKLPITVHKGRANLGLIPIGDIPPLL